MDITTITDVIGYIASACLVLGYLPQAIVTMRTRETDGIAMPTFVMLGLGSLFFVINGLLWGNMPLVICNAITTICSIIIFVIKIQNDRKKRQK